MDALNRVPLSRGASVVPVRLIGWRGESSNRTRRWREWRFDASRATEEGGAKPALELAEKICMADSEMESFEERLRRWTMGADREWALTVFMMLRNTLETEVREASKSHSLMLTLLGIHAVIQILTEKVFGLGKGPGTTQFYQEQFVDTPERKYSAIADKIHRERNDIAHQGFSIYQYSIAYDWAVNGLEWKGSVVHLNPDHYVEDYVAGSHKYSRVARKMISELDMVKRKYAYICSFLDLPKGDALRTTLAGVKNMPDLATLRTAEAGIQQAILAKYGIK
jgi:hypothetical protein